MDDLPKAVTWILSGATVAAAVVSLVGLAPRLAGAYPGWLQLAIIVILFGFLLGCVAVVIQLLGATGATLGRHAAVGCVAAGMVCVVAGTAVLALSYQATLSKEDVPRLTLSVTGGDQRMATVKAKFEADGLDPGQSLIVDLIAVKRGTEIPVGVGQLTPGHRFYRAAIGSDSTGKVTSEIETDIKRADYEIVVAEVWPGPLSVETSAPNNQAASTALCGNVGTEKKDPRSCAYAEVPA